MARAEYCIANSYSGNSRIVTAIADREGMAFYLTDSAAARYGCR